MKISRMAFSLLYVFLLFLQPIITFAAAVDSTQFSAPVTAPKKQGYINPHDNMISYPPNPAKDSLPIPPAACVLPEEIMNTLVGRAKSVVEVTGCSSWGCKGCTGWDAANPACWAALSACELCVLTCSVFSCGCGGLTECKSEYQTYKWSDTDDGALEIKSITCGTPDWK